jgi:hypothetical protein
MTKTSPDRSFQYKIAMDAIKEASPSVSLVEADKAVTKTLDQAPAFTGDIWFYRGVAIGLVSIVLLVLIGGILLSGTGHTLDTAFVAVGSAAVGGLVGIFAVNK